MLVQVAVSGMVYPLRSCCLGFGTVRHCPVRRRCCVTPVSLDDACWCVSWLSQGSRWACGQTSPPQGRLDRAVNNMHLGSSYRTALYPMHRDIFFRYILNSSPHALIPGLPVGPSGAKRSVLGVVNGLVSEEVHPLQARRSLRRRRALHRPPLSKSTEPLHRRRPHAYARPITPPC